MFFPALLNYALVSKDFLQIVVRNDTTDSFGLC